MGQISGPVTEDGMRKRSSLSLGGSSLRDPQLEQERARIAWLLSDRALSAHDTVLIVCGVATAGPVSVLNPLPYWGGWVVIGLHRFGSMLPGSARTERRQ